MNTPPYYRHRFAAEIISYRMWLYFRFCLSYRDVEEMIAQRGVAVTYETIREWGRKFGRANASRFVFCPGRHLLAVKNFRELVHRRFTQWRVIARLSPAV